MERWSEPFSVDKKQTLFVSYFIRNALLQKFYESEAIRRSMPISTFCCHWAPRATKKYSKVKIMDFFHYHKWWVFLKNIPKKKYFLNLHKIMNFMKFCGTWELFECSIFAFDLNLGEREWKKFQKTKISPFSSKQLFTHIRLRVSSFEREHQKSEKCKSSTIGRI